MGDYCCQLVESVAGIHFHVSLLGETPRGYLERKDSGK